MKSVFSHPLRRTCRMLALALVAACAGFRAAAVQADESSPGGEWTDVRVGDEIAGEDHWQGFNRTMFDVEDIVMDYIACPLSRVYCSVVPKPLVLGIDNALNNVEYPARLCAALLGGEGACAWDETMRFAVNSTVGLGGLFDPAQNMLGIIPTESSFSWTFASWGLPKGKSLILPFVLRTNVRDCTGYILDMGLDPETYVDFFFPSGIIIGWTAALWPNYLAIDGADWKAYVKPERDPYAAYRRMLAAKSLLDERQAVYRYLNEYVANEDGTRRPPVREPILRPDGLKGRWTDISGFEPRTPALDTMRQSLFAPARDDDMWWMRASIFNGDFANDVEERCAAADQGVQSARYGFVSAAGQHRRLIFVVPGLGEEFNANPTLAMAELIHDAGADVVTLDSPFHWRNAVSAGGGTSPDAFSDARRLAVLIRSVIDDLAKDGCVDDPEISVVGWSSAGVLVAHLAELERRGELGFDVGSLLAVNPPVDFDHAASAVESFMAPSRSWTREQAIEKFLDIAPRLLIWEELHFAATPDVSDADARHIVASSLVTVLPRIDGCRTAEKALHGNSRLRVIHTRDDFLLNEDDRRYLDDALGDRITWFSAGAHCGMFYTPEFRQAVLERLDLKRSSS